MNAPPVLDVLGLEARVRKRSRREPERTVLAGIDLRVSAGECVAIVGASGAGKSVLARSLLGLTREDPQWRVSAESLALNGTDLARASAATWRRHRGTRVSLVLQDALQSLDPLRRIGDEVGETLAIHRMPRNARGRTVHAALTAAGLPDPDSLLTRRSEELSGGMRQRALIAAALVGGPDLIVADEPTASLDPATAGRVLDELSRIREAGTALVLISHDLAAVARIADRIAVLDGGRIVETGPAASLLSHPSHPTTRALIAAHRLALTRPARPAPVSGPPLVRLTGVTRAYGMRGGRFTGVANADLAVRRGEAVGVTGESGAGKTTLARIIAGAEPIDSGTIERSGTARLIPQDPLATFDPRWRVRRILDAANRGSLTAGELLVRVGLGTEHLDRFPATLSGGERQRVAIARALATEADLLVCDEPVSALDPANRAAILELLASLLPDVGIIFVSHDLDAVEALCDRTVTVHDGALRAGGGCGTGGDEVG